MKRWKRTLGSDATYSNLSDVFERAGYKNYAAFTKELVTVAKSYRHATSIQEGPSLSSQKPVYPEADSSLPFVTKSARILNLKKKHQGKQILIPCKLNMYACMISIKSGDSRRNQKNILTCCSMH